jgi:hypothetical protein
MKYLGRIKQDVLEEPVTSLNVSRPCGFVRLITVYRNLETCRNKLTQGGSDRLGTEVKELAACSTQVCVFLTN